MQPPRPQLFPRRIGWAFAGVILLFLLVTGFSAWSFPDSARRDRDEGLNLMKARLVSSGYRLYADIWSDQPPAYTYALIGWGKLFDDRVSTLRTLSTLFSALALAMAGLLVWRWSGGDRIALIAGLVTVVLIVGTRQYEKLSSAVMIGLPAVAVAMLSVFLVTLATTSRMPLAMVLATLGGVVFALSMQIKLFTFILIPMTVAVIMRAEDGRRSRLVLSIAWTLGLVATMAIFFAVWGSAWRDQLIAPHVNSRAISLTDNLVALLSRLAEDLPVTAAAIVGLILAGPAARRAAFPAVLWVITSLIVLANAKPLWTHHRIMLTIPLAMITGICLARFARDSNLFNPFKIAVAIIVVAGLVRTSAVMIQRRIDSKDRTLDAFYQQLQDQSPRPRWIVSDDPHPVYAAGLVVPPEIAVLSAKRLWSAGDVESLLTQTIDKYKPPLVYLSRHLYSPQFHAHLQPSYEKIAGNGETHLYRLKSPEP